MSRGGASYFREKLFHQKNSKRKDLGVEVGMDIEGIVMRLVWLIAVIGNSDLHVQVIQSQ